MTDERYLCKCGGTGRSNYSHFACDDCGGSGLGEIIPTPQVETTPDLVARLIYWAEFFEAGEPRSTPMTERFRQAARLLKHLTAKLSASEALLRRVEPHLDAIICYASTMGEHEPNRIAFDIRAALARQEPEGASK